MLPLPEDIRSDDIQQWLSEGVYYAKQKDEWVIVTYSGLADNGKIIGIALDGKTRIDSGIGDVRIHWPACGAVNLPDGFAVIVTRQQRRQWRRTFNGRCVTLEIPGKWEIMKKVKPRTLNEVQAYSPSLLRAVFEPEYPESVTQALDELADRASIAISPQVVLVGPAASALVYYRGTPVGQLNHGGFAQSCDHVTGMRIRKLLGDM